MKRILAYVILVFGLSSIFYYLIINSVHLGLNSGLLILGLMYCPAVSAFICSYVFEKTFSNLGLGIGKPIYLLIGYLIPVGYGFIGYGFIWLAGFGAISKTYHIDAFSLIVTMSIFSIISAFGEEVGWRGYLLPQLMKITSFTKACIITGIIWAVWHFPIIISGQYLAHMSLALQLILLVTALVSFTFVLGWLRVASGSIWPVVLMHASHNNYLQAYFDPVTVEKSPFTKYLIGESGIVLTVIFIIMGLIVWKMQKHFLVVKKSYKK